MKQIRTENINNWLVIRFVANRLTDPMTVAQICDETDQLLMAIPERAQVAISFAGVDFVSSQVIGLLLGIRDQVRKKHGTLVLCKVGKHVLDVLRITRLERQFTLSDSLSAIVGKRKVSAGRSSDVNWIG
jgi:anti-anti-sigma factor